jgi:hypothetical protein
MKHRIRQALAHSFYPCTAIPAVVLPIALLVAGDPTLTQLREWSFLPSILMMLLSLSALGWLSGAIFVWPTMGRLVSRINGAPFSVGERVTILVGPHRGQVAPIYAIWAERGQVRVDLGVEKQITVKDVYAYFQICRPNT